MNKDIIIIIENWIIIGSMWTISHIHLTDIYELINDIGFRLSGKSFGHMVSFGCTIYINPACIRDGTSYGLTVLNLGRFAPLTV